MSPNVRWISTTAEYPWQECNATRVVANTDLTLVQTGTHHQSWEGFGGCFNELGWRALSGLSTSRREEVLQALFHPRDGCRFNRCRLPIGASDYAVEWYSHNEADGDFVMEHFSIARDRQLLIPYINAARTIRPDLQLFASPWSPPTWLKSPKAYNYGTLRWEPKYLQAYADYFLCFIRAYRDAGIPIHQIHVQNEPSADQKFPSCLWSGAQLRDFVRDYLGPLFRREMEPCEIWLGTLNSEDYDGFPHLVLSDPVAAAYVNGVGVQWAAKAIVQRIAMSLPGVRLMQTENECGDGQNSWEYARYIYNLLWHYITNGVQSYIYWNMVLAPDGMSTWGWRQNAMITVDPTTDSVTYNPEYFVMKHFAHFVVPGATRLGLQGAWAGNAVAFTNPDGSQVIVVMNPFPTPSEFMFKAEDSTIVAQLDGYSFNTFVV